MATLQNRAALRPIAAGLDNLGRARKIPAMDALFRLSGAARRDPEVEAWFDQGDPLRALVQPWFAALRRCGDDVGELIHDGRPTACVAGAAFAYVDAFSVHASLGFFDGAALDDPAGLLEGAGKRMRHVKLRWGAAIDAPAVQMLIDAAYRDVHRRLDPQRQEPPAGRA